MTFWAYMLHCRGGYFYVGHTDDLERRVAQHERGNISDFASDHRPVRLVWSEAFPTRHEALEAERRLKGWSRAKKQALIRGDWGDLPVSARGKHRASTSSARTDFRENLALVPHCRSLPKSVESVAVELAFSEGQARLVYRVNGAAVRLPEAAPAERTDGLWKTTCFELFVRSGTGDDYVEFNLSPSTRWAAYAFDGYRVGMRDLPVSRPPDIVVERSPGRLECTAGIDLAVLPQNTEWCVSLSAVIEETDGTKSYWALVHPPDKPDFHDPACFALRLPAAARP